MEQPSKRQKVVPELIPAPLWGMSLANLANRRLRWSAVWRKIREHELRRSEGRCDYCGSQIGLTVHEVWEYDDERHVQALVGFRVSCRACALVSHMGFASVQGLQADAIKHLMRINRLPYAEASEIVKRAFRTWEERSAWPSWTQDFSWLRENVLKIRYKFCGIRGVGGRYWPA